MKLRLLEIFCTNEYAIACNFNCFTFTCSLIGGLTITLTGAYRLRRQIATEQMQRNSATYLRFNKK